jgi:D-alanyl-D-alanine carboxypeptidase (penicillin-binding protein 5/6)
MSTITRKLGLALVAASVAFGASSAPAYAARATSTSAAADSRYAAIVVEASTGEVLYARRADSPRYPASITKIMTLYLVFEEMAAGRLRPNDMITVSARAAAMPPTKLGLRPGEQISVDDAIRAIALRSANDMAVAMAERVAGSESRFAALMTLRARELGMANTHFVNASGLPDTRQISSARDIAILSRAVMRDFPQYYAYFSQRQFSFRGETINNHNHLLDRMPEVDGLKTGFISASGYNLAASGVRNGHRVIAVVLGGSSGRARDNNVASLLTTGFDILHRRDQGETILATQNLFEPTQDGQVQLASRGPIQYGGGSDISFTSGRAPAGLQIVSGRDSPLRPAQPTQPAYSTSPNYGMSPAYAAQAQPRAVPPQRAAPQPVYRTATADAAPQQAAAQPSRSATASAGPSGNSWGIQVGAFRNRWDARDQLEHIASNFGGQLRGTRAIIATYSDGMYRARFVGLEQTAAQSACAHMQRRNETCMVVAPD